ncbi:putative beta-mannosidase [Phyllosticta citribraziliensis]
MTVRPLTTQVLDTGWSFKQTDAPDDDWLPAPLVPSCVHQDLLANQKIQDPFLGFNEIGVEWVGEKPWTYKTSLPVQSTPVQDGRKYVLAFDGLDTYATAKLNGNVILQSDNMFHSHRVDITKTLSSASPNVLEVAFLPALKEAQKVKAAHPEHKWVGFNADMARLAVRKAQYHFGWDWGPVLITSGIWKEVRLETYHARIENVRIDYELDQDLKRVSGVITLTVEGDGRGKALVRGEVDGKTALHVEAQVDDHGVAKAQFIIDSPALWWPHGYGSQPLYSIKSVLLSADGTEVDERTQRLGIRKAELVQQPDDVGKSFFFRINNTDVFCGGSDWIPADSFTPRITTARYRSWLQTMVDGHQVMVRVWGGGIYEAEAFYDACDELGILVWQDFMFGCGNYPAWKEMRESIRREATQNVQRLQKHTSVVLYAGNNEDYQVQEQFGLTYNYQDKDPENWLRTDFPARYIYEKILPEVVAAESPSVPYHPGSPWGDGLPTSDRTVGDLHQWNVWHGSQEKYQIFDTLGGRFNSEFGMEAFPHIDTIKHYVTDDSQLYPQSHMLDFHNKADGHERRIATYLVENFRTVTDLEGFIHLTQLSQAEALMFGYRGWRRQWGQKRFCGGALVWQLNDCWPVTSWSIIDYFQRKKPAYYAMRRVLAPVAVAVKRAHHDWSVVHARPAKTSAWELWASSSKTHEVVATIELRFISIATGKDIKQSVTKAGVRIKANGTTEVLSGTIDNETEEAHVLAARLWIDGHAEVVSRDMDWPQPLKYLDFSERGVEVVQGFDVDGGWVRVTAARPTKGVVFEERYGVLADDSALDVAPGDAQVVRVRGLGQDARPLRWRYLGQPGPGVVVWP